MTDIKLSAKDVYLLKLYRKLKDARIKLLWENIKKLLTIINRNNSNYQSQSLSLDELSGVVDGSRPVQTNEINKVGINNDSDPLGNGNELVGFGGSANLANFADEDSYTNSQVPEVNNTQNESETILKTFESNDFENDINTNVSNDDTVKGLEVQSFEDQIHWTFSHNGDVLEMTTTSDGEIATVTWNIMDVNAKEVKNISPDVFSEFEEIQFNQLDPSCIAAMTSQQFDSLPNSAFDSEPQELGIEQWAYAPETLAALTPDQMQVFAAEATQEFKVELLSELTVETFETFDQKQISTLIEQVEQSIPKDILRLASETDLDLKDFDFDQFSDQLPENTLNLLQEQILPNLPPQIANLIEPSQIAALGDNVYLLPKDFLDALNESQLAAIGKN